MTIMRQSLVQLWGKIKPYQSRDIKAVLNHGRGPVHDRDLDRRACFVTSQAEFRRICRWRSVSASVD